MPFQPPGKINPPPTQEQFWGSTAIRTPEQRLWLEVCKLVLEDGDLEWLESYTFELWCESIGLEAERVRGRVSEMGRAAA